MIKVKFKSQVINVIRRLDRVQRDFFRHSESCFVHTLRPAISEIKKRVRGDKNFNHVFTGNLLKNIRAELDEQSFTNDFDGKVVVEFGYFVPYGLNLEKGSKPYYPSFNKMYQWAANKLRRRREYTKRGSKDFAGRVRARIGKMGSTSYPIITSVFQDYKKEYFEKSTQMFFKKVFGKRS